MARGWGAICGMDLWTRTLVEESAFAEEQTKLAGVWTFLGLTSDLNEEDAWITGRVGGRAVFVQRFGATLRGFENLCVHRGFPLRLGAKGRGAVICGFHLWRYDADGRVAGVPIAQEAFGCSAEDLHAGLAELEVACCGGLVFGRFADQAPAGLLGGDLEAFLGDAFPMLETICQFSDAPAVRTYGRTVEANWKLMVNITLDDSHLPGIHGRKRFSRRDEFDYWRFGAHSAHTEGQQETQAGMLAACVEGVYQPIRYKLFNLFPNVAVGLLRLGPYWYVLLQHFEPVGPAKTNWRAHYFRTPWRAGAEPWLAPQWPRTTDRIVAWLFEREARRVNEEDHVACERQQTNARNIPPPADMLSVHEERIGWFYETWAMVLQPDEPPKTMTVKAARA